MTKMKLCGLFRPCDIDAANELKPEYIGFVFAPKSRRYVTPEKAAELKKLLDPDIQAVGVFVNEAAEQIAALLNKGIIDIAQLHGAEDENDINQLRTLTDKPIIKAFCLKEIIFCLIPAKGQELYLTGRRYKTYKDRISSLAGFPLIM